MRHGDLMHGVIDWMPVVIPGSEETRLFADVFTEVTPMRDDDEEQVTPMEEDAVVQDEDAVVQEEEEAVVQEEAAGQSGPLS